MVHAATIPPPQLLLLAKQRRLTEAQWRKSEAEANDERQQTIYDNAALITCAAGAVTIYSAMLYVVLREPENETALLRW